MAYQVPSLQISQEFAQLPVFNTTPLAPLIIGPYYADGAFQSFEIDSTVSWNDDLFDENCTVTVATTPTNGEGAILQPINNGGYVDLKIVSSGRGYAPVHYGSNDPSNGTDNITITVTDKSGGTHVLSVFDYSVGSICSMFSDSIYSVSSDSDIISLFGSIDTPTLANYATTPTDAHFINNGITPSIAYALHCAVQNANGVPIYFTTLSSNDNSGYTQALSLAEKSDKYYGIVPLSYSTGVTSQVVGHINKMSTKEKAKWRTCWLGTYSNHAYGAGDTDAYVSNLNLVQILSNISYTQDVSHTGVSASVDGGPRRIHYVFPNSYYIDAVTPVAGYYLCCALAGLRAGSVPHQPLTNTTVVGPYHLDKTISKYSETQLNTLAEAGVWIVTQDQKGGSAYTRHQLTADSSGNLNYREDSVTANVDTISYGLKNALAPYVGVYNISPTAIQSVQAAVDAELRYRLTNTYTNRAGNQLLSYKIVSIAQDSSFLDKLNIVIQIQVPYPMNYITVALSI